MVARGTLFFKERDVRRAVRAFLKEGLPLQGGRIDRNGNIEVFTGKMESAEGAAPPVDGPPCRAADAGSCR